MSRYRTIEVEGTVTDSFPNRTFVVRMRNDHTVLAHCPREVKPESIHLLRGDKVMLEMTPYDLSKGRIICRQQ